MENNKGRLLIVEDEPNIATVLGIALRKEGYLVEIAESVREAVDHLTREPVDLLITDWVLPDGTGGQVCEAARTTKGLLPIIVMSAVLNEKSQTLAECKPDAFLAKPLRMGQLLLQVHDLLAGPSNT